MSSHQAVTASLGSGGYNASKRSARNVLPASTTSVTPSSNAAPAMTSTGTDALIIKGSGAAVNQAPTIARPSYTDGAATNGTSRYRHSSGVGNNANTANGSGNEPKINTGSSTSGTAAATTESVIEELKALAKSMLEATNAARRRTSSIEQRNSYEALMHAIENRVNGDTVNITSIESKDAAASTGGYAAAPATATAAPKHVDPMATNGISQSEMLSAHLTEQLTDIPAALSPGSCVRQQSQQLPPAQRKKYGKEEVPTVAAAETDAAVRNTQQPAVPSQQQQQQCQRADMKHHADVADVGSEDDDDDGGAAQGDNEQALSLAALHSQPPITRRHAPTAMLEADEDEDDDDGTAYDGVKTQVLFKPVNRAAYREVVASTWKPEGLTRRTNTAGSGSQQNRNSNSSSSASEYKDSPHHPNSSDDDEEAIATMATRNKTGRAAARTAPSMKVFRVPSFPYGGGVTEQQARILQRQFDECIHNGEHLSSNAAGPALITKRDFDSGNYTEVSAATAQMDTTSFQPTSPYEFVVEVERDVRFDAVKAREERRHRFRQLVREKRAPATMGTFNLRVIMDPFKTGFEEEKNFPIVPGTVIAGRYEIIQMLGKATFSRAVRCYDLQDPIYNEDEESDEGEYEDDVDDDDANSATASPADGTENVACIGKGGVTTASCRGSDTATTASASKQQVKSVNTATKSRLKPKRRILGYGQVCLKIINNTKDFFDQSLDEIRLLTLLNRQKDPDDAHIVRLIDAFYYKEHVMLVTELLRDTLYDYGKYNREEEKEFYFTLPRLRRLTRQIVEALTYVHSLNLIHTDLKPENIMFVSYSRCIVKVIDFGSSCFLSDHLSSYIQSRSYRAPEVVLGCDYDGRIDVWSLGAILVEMVTGDVLFTSDTVPEMLARIVYVCGTPFPRRMLWEGRHTSDYINKFGCIYEYGGGADGQHDRPEKGDTDDGEEPYCLYTPVPTMAPHTCASSRKSRAAAAVPPPPRTTTAPYSVLREKLAAANMVDEEFIAFVEACLMLDHKKRPTSAELLEHPFIRDVVL
ncbi:protein_kinase_-_putative [Leishmania infantum]|uniref:Protein_kinase_-_putative n=2 Tax=Leishmania infantum TaxID=5671 RepID=A0A6L0WQT5_LEIIN|nr:protein_kinase_-_putative [Leishmania infantum]SUZ40344.1 protein_kinase_-_putative [Leishmania infantum]